MTLDATDPSGPEPTETVSDCAPKGILTDRHWRRATQPAAEAVGVLRRELPGDFQLSDPLLAILAGRGFQEASALERFFYPSLDHLPDPFLLSEMDAAVTRLLQAARGCERVAIHGDFDVDGISGATLMAKLLVALSSGGGKAIPEPTFIPDRIVDGYGVATRMIQQWAEGGVDLLITIDTGAAAHVEMNLARDLGLDVIVLDHHIFDQRPQVVALINPHRPGSRYPNQDLCGVAVAFKFVQALRQAEADCLPPGFEESVLDLVALGLVADQMPMVGENRSLVRKGMGRMEDRSGIRPGLAALLSIAGLDRGFSLGAADLAYQIIPRLNACGRIGRVQTALDLLMTDDPGEAQRLAREADRTNLLRRQADQVLKDEALRMAEPYLARGARGLVLASPNWHKGIIGIGASRLVERYHVPAILIAIEGEEARGSARSFADIDVKAVLDRCAGLLIRYGGHTQAAGMTLHARDIDAFRTAFLAALDSEPDGGPNPKVYDIDLPLPDMTAGHVAELVSEIHRLEPFGIGNRKPVFRCDSLRLSRPPQMLGDGSHLRFAFRADARSPAVRGAALGREFVSFSSTVRWQRWLSGAALAEGEVLARRWDILFQVNRNTYRPRGENYDPVQQLLLDLRPADES